jgi:hypothetical protein
VGTRLTLLFFACALFGTFGTFSTAAAAHGISPADQAAMLNGGLLRYVQLGATHMVTGYDHLLFLLGVVFFLDNVSNVVKFVTAFTVGHSVTLIGATFAGISADPFLVDAVIALSVCYKGFDNNGYWKSYLDVRAPNLLGMVFAFGLVHGFGLSTRLQHLPLGDDKVAIFGRIVAFNAGVELGQLTALLVMIFLLRAWRTRPRFLHFSRVANDAIIAAGVLLFLMQMHGYLHTTHPDDFGFSVDAHAHAHADAEAKAQALQAPIEVTPHDNL